MFKVYLFLYLSWDPNLAKRVGIPHKRTSRNSEPAKSLLLAVNGMQEKEQITYLHIYVYIYTVGWVIFGESSLFFKGQLSNGSLQVYVTKKFCWLSESCVLTCRNRNKLMKYSNCQQSLRPFFKTMWKVLFSKETFTFYLGSLLAHLQKIKLQILGFQ